jgi:hypothetical protein
LSFAIDVGELGTTRFAAIYQDAYDGGAAGYLLFASDDAGTTWQFVTFVAVAITCMDVDEPGIFFGGAGDVAGAGWAIHDPTGATVLKQSRVSDGQDSVAVDQPIVACDWLPAGQQSTIFIAQTSNEVLPESRLRTHNPWGPFDRWDRYPYFPAEPFRITALDLQQQHSRVLTAFEHLMLGPGGYGVRAYRGVLPLQTGDPMGEEVDPYAMTPGARAAIQLDGDIALYPDGRVVIGLFEAELVGLPNRTTITSARADANRTLWLSTADGLFRSKEPIR